MVARSVTIVDEHGEGQIYFSADSRTGAQIHVMNGDGPGIHIDVIEGRPSIVFWSNKKKMRLSLGCDDVAAGLMLHDSKGKPVAICGIDPKGKVKQSAYKKSMSSTKKRGK